MSSLAAVIHRDERIMLPREHGAYGQLFAPLITALAIGRPGVAAFALSAAAVLAFAAHEPLLVLIGRRGVRAARERGAEARRWLAIFGVPAVAFGAIGIITMDATARLALLAPAIGTVALGELIAIGSEHTGVGEVLTAVVLASLAWPVGLAAGVSPFAALTCAVAFGAGFAAATVCVRAVIDSTRRPPAYVARTAGGVIAAAFVVVLFWLARSGMLAGAAPWTALPLCGAGVALVIAPPSARRLRIVGWTLIGTTVLTSAALIVALR